MVKPWLPPRCQAAAAEAEAAALRALQLRRRAAAEAARLGSALRCEAGARAAAERWLRAELASRVRPAPAAGHRAVRAAVVRRAPCTLTWSACMPMSICLPDAGATRSRQCCCRACCPCVLPSLGD